MELNRRETLALGAGAALMTVLPFRAFASASDDLIAEFTGGAEVTEGGALELTAPEIAENGNTVPIAVSAEGASAIMVLATGNPTPPVGTFTFGPLAGSRSASTRIRLAGTQDVVAIAKMEDGTFTRAAKTVKVTIGGCGG
ncbi:thiosulfate oxidation carrier protein SoxY [Pseudooceanicola sp. C21-150M6]|uniref:thiosulfate oxidation carrier protein SoxY n=1 Tax=Pseudooceanicola sp. C21-150M6 TaxID=3434355 RepID=UPI003D7F623C